MISSRVWKENVTLQTGKGNLSKVIKSCFADHSICPPLSISLVFVYIPSNVIPDTFSQCNG